MSICGKPRWCAIALFLVSGLRRFRHYHADNAAPYAYTGEQSDRNSYHCNLTYGTIRLSHSSISMYGGFMLQLELDPRSGEHTAIVRCTGRIVFQEEAKSLAEMVRILIATHDQVVLDLSQVRDVDSAGLGTLASLHLAARERGSSFVLMN